MTTLSFTLFETALGTGGIAWGNAGILRCNLPEPDPDLVRERMHREIRGAVEVTHAPPDIADAIAQITRLLEGEVADFSAARLDMRAVPPFKRSVYDFVKNIPRGSTFTYGEVALRLGQPGASRAIGQAMATNPFAPIVPCHRVLAAGNKPGGFSAHGGALTKMRLLQMEGAVQDDLLGW
jgi:methylated-DNA-[protein]-cysteine S-methyltransferase